MVMSINQRIELIKRNTSEIVGEEELRELLKGKKEITLYHGFEPSGTGLHIGTMIGVNKHIDFQKAGLKLRLLCADLHSYLNKKGSLSKIEHIAELYKEGFAALGVDMKKAEYILGSEFQLGHDYVLDVLELSLKVRSLRANRAMSIIAREEKDPHVSQMIYPLMQVADIKHLKIDIAFGDMPQRKIHMLARENLPGLDYKSPIAIHHEDMVGLTGGKMSASIPNSRIMIDEDPDSIRKKIQKAFCPEKQIKNNPILQICEFIIFPRQGKLKIKRDKKYGKNLEFKDYKQLEKSYEKNLHPFDLKNAVAESLIKVLEPVRKHMLKKSIVELKKLIDKMD
jgi:tyrosyl-tRNA synthetase|tara:strand:+ start:11127 stop:12143 length:1017 start_codon:yes stop_codon:yes gene_type:complete